MSEPSYAGEPLNVAPLGSNVFPVQAVVSWFVIGDEWVIESALVRTAAGTANDPAWPEMERSIRPSHWDHVANLVGVGGGDGVTWDVDGFETTDEDLVATIAMVRVNLANAKLYEPPDDVINGLMAAPSSSYGSYSALPLFLLRDNKQVLNVIPLDQSRIDRYRVTTGYLGSARWGQFRSSAYPRLHRSPSWKVHGGFICAVGFSERLIEFRLGADGRVAYR